MRLLTPPQRLKVLADARGLVLKRQESIWRHSASLHDLQNRTKETQELHAGGGDLQPIVELVRDTTPVQTRQEGSDRISLFKLLTPLSGMPGGNISQFYIDGRV
jgi:hypothetical protein